MLIVLRTISSCLAFQSTNPPGQTPDQVETYHVPACLPAACSLTPVLGPCVRSDLPSAPVSVPFLALPGDWLFSTFSPCLFLRLSWEAARDLCRFPPRLLSRGTPWARLLSQPLCALGSRAFSLCVSGSLSVSCPSLPHHYILWINEQASESSCSKEQERQIRNQCFLRSVCFRCCLYFLLSFLAGLFPVFAHRHSHWSLICFYTV